VSAYLPHAADLLAVLISWALVPTLVMAGRVTGADTPIETRLVAGWGLLCLVLTPWGVTLPISMYMPALAFVSLAWGALAVPAWRPAREEWVTLWRLLVISLPLWLVMAPLRPSQIDTFLNLLPDAAYLANHGMFPSQMGGDSHSFLPVAPYNSQLVAFLGSLAMPVFPSHGMSFFNLILQLAMGLVFARLLTGQGQSQGQDQGQEREQEPGVPSWGAIAGGLLLAIPLNPGFVPREFLAPYGEPALAVTAGFAAFLMLRRNASGLGGSSGWVVGLVLAAMVNTKQSGVGLVAALAVAYVVVAAVDRRPFRDTVRFLVQALLPSIVLYLLWRFYVLRYFPGGELKPLPWHLWQWGYIPQILASMGHYIVNKGVFYGLVLLSVVLLVVKLRWQGRTGGRWTLGSRALLFHAALFVAYDLFLILTYIGHFKPADGDYAHSYFRYSLHLSLVMVLAYVLALKEHAGIMRFFAARARLAATAAIILMLVLPAAFAQRLRFDLDVPQPWIWDMVRSIAPHLNQRDRLALLLPGDDSSVDAYVEGELRDTAVRLSGLETIATPRADDATLAAVVAAGYQVALVSCSDALLKAPPADPREPIPTGFVGDSVAPASTLAPGLAGIPSSLDHATIPPGSAVLLRWRGGVWRVVASWTWPHPHGHREAIHVTPPLCHTP